MASALPRLEQLLGEEVARIPRELVSQAVDLIVFIERFCDEDGALRRRVVDVATVEDELDRGTQRYVLKSLPDES